MFDLEFGRWKPSRGAETSLGDLYSSAYEGAVKIDNQNAARRQLEASYDRVNDEIKKATGVEVQNPFRSAVGSIGSPGIPGLEDDTTGDPYKYWDNEIERLSRDHPDALDWGTVKGRPLAELQQGMQAAETARQSANYRRGMVDGKSLPVVGNVPLVRELVAGGVNVVRDPAGMAAQFAGSLRGQVESPADLAVNIMGGFAGGPTQSLIKNAVKNALANAAGQALLEPGVQANRAMGGLEYGWGVALDDIAGAAGIGFTLDLGIRGPSRAVLNRFGRDVAPGEFASRNTPRGGLFLDSPAPNVDLPRPPPVRSPVSTELIRRAEAGDVAAMREIAEKTGAIENPVVKGALDFADMGGKVDETAIAKFRELGIDEGEGLRTLAAVMRDPEAYIREPAPIRKADAAPMIEEARRLTEQNAGELDKLRQAIGPRLDAIDPRLAGYVDAAIEAGLGDIIPAVEKAVRKLAKGGDPDKVAQSFVKALTTLADKEGLEKLTAKVAVQAGRGSVLEVAKAMRDHPDVVDSNTRLNTEFMRTARAIAALDEPAWGRVASGEVPAALAAEVANYVPPGQHARVVDDVMRAGVTTRQEARALIPDFVRAARADAGQPLSAGSKIDDVGGAAAKKQTAALEQDMAREVEEATAPIRERAKLESQIEDLKGEQAKLEDQLVTNPNPDRGPFSLSDADLTKRSELNGQIRQAEVARAALMQRSPLFDLVITEAAKQRARDVTRAVTDALALADRILPDGRRQVAIVSDEITDPVSGRLLEAEYDPETGLIALADYALNPAARLSHEALHALVARGMLTKPEVALLAKAGRETGAFPPEREGAYREAYADRRNLNQILDEEAAAHYVEAKVRGTEKAPSGELTRLVDLIQRAFERLRNAWNGYGFRTADDIRTAILVGRMAERRPNDPWVTDGLPRYAMPEPMLAREADSLVRDVKAFEDALWRRGATAEEVAAQISDRYGFDVKPADIAAQRVWWRVAEGSDWGGSKRMDTGEITDTVRNIEDDLLARIDEGLPPEHVAPALTEGRQGAMRNTRAEPKGQTAPLSFPRVGLRLTPELRARAVEMWKAGRSAQQIASAFERETGKYVRVLDVVGVLDTDGAPVVKAADSVRVWTKDAEAALVDAKGLTAAEAAQKVLETAGVRVTAKAVARKRANLKAEGKIEATAKPQGSWLNEGKFEWTDEATALLTSKEVAAMKAPDAALLLSQRFGGELTANAIRVRRHKLAKKTDARYAIADDDPEAWLAGRNADAQVRDNAAGPDAGEGRGVAGVRADAAEGQPAEAAADRAGPERVGSGGDAGAARRRHEVQFGIPGHFAVTVDGKPTVRGEATRYYFVYKDGRTMPSEKLSDASALKMMNGIANWSGRMRLVEREPGRWEVTEIKVRKDEQRRGLASALYDAVEMDSGIELRPSGMLTLDGYEFWRRRDPASVQFHRRVGDGYVNPKQMVAMKLWLDDIATSSGDIKQIATALKQNEQLNKAMADLPPEATAPETFDKMFALADEQTGQSMRRDLDALGYYSQALEAAKGLKQAKGTPEQMLAQIKAAGVKDAEIEATGLSGFLEGKKSVTKAEIATFLEQSRVRLNEVSGGIPQLEYWPIKSEDARNAALPAGTSRVAKWQNYSLDPSNPTYRETVLHLPESMRAQEIEARMKENQRVIFDISEQAKDPRANPDFAPLRAARSENAKLLDELKEINANKFRSGHFPEPNIIGHMMTSMVKHEGKPTYLIDQIQSDWGQKLRDGGVRDEAKIAELKRRAAEAEQDYIATPSGASWLARVQQISKAAGLSEPSTYKDAYSNLTAILNRRDHMQDTARSIHRASADDPAAADFRRLYAEAATAESATSGNPLVNTTDQWVNTTLRRAIRQAAEADAQFIAIPSGKTVLSYNPGDEAGMEGFYNGIVPKNLRNLLRKIDKAAPDPIRTDKLDTPTRGMKGEGFTVFPLTDKVRNTVIEGGQPLFALSDHAPPATSGRQRQRIEIDVPGHYGVAIAGSPTVRGEAQKFYFVYKEGQTVPTDAASDHTAFRSMARMANWQARLHVVERSPGQWDVVTAKARLNAKNMDLAEKTIIAAEQDLGSSLRRDPTAERGSRYADATRGDQWQPDTVPGTPSEFVARMEMPQMRDDVPTISDPEPMLTMDMEAVSRMEVLRDLAMACRS